MSGITEYIIADIYDYIDKHMDREFFLEFCAIEIYDESVRDLLSADSTPLRLLDDPEMSKGSSKIMSDEYKGAEKVVVCVTGASGYIASWLVKLLLQRGYTVKATVRDPNDAEKTDHLLSLDGAKERLQLLKANLLDEDSFDRAVEGCVGVFHTASPCHFDAKDPQAELIDPAVKGTLNVLNSCTKYPSIKRVILTSSMGSVLVNEKIQAPDVLVDETWFSDPNFCNKTKHWYALSKTLAEDAAWNFVKKKGIDMVVINPSMTIGPLLQSKLSSSTAVFLKMISGEETKVFGMINVKDVANAHIQAFEIPSASGRYCLVERVFDYSEVLRILHALYPALPLPKKSKDDDTFVPNFQVSKEKAKSLGIDFIPLETSLKEIVESFKERNFLVSEVK